MSGWDIEFNISFIASERNRHTITIHGGSVLYTKFIINQNECDESCIQLPKTIIAPPLVIPNTYPPATCMSSNLTW